MTLDQRAARAAEALHRHLDGTAASRADLEARQRTVQRRRMRTALAGFVVLVLVAVPALLLGRAEDEGGPATPGGGQPPSGTLTSGAWSSVPVHTSGLGDGSIVRAMASTSDGIVAVGSRPVDGGDVRAAWFSEDGLTWVVADAPEAPGLLTAVGADGDALVAVGASTSTGGPASSARTATPQARQATMPSGSTVGWSGTSRRSASGSRPLALIFVLTIPTRSRSRHPAAP